MKIAFKGQPEDISELEKLLTKPKKIKKDQQAQEQPEGPDMRLIKKAFFRVKRIFL